MADEDDYELLPHREIQRLKEEISKLKGGQPVESDKELKRAVVGLSEKIESMNEILEAASQDLREEDKEAEIIKDKIDPIMNKMAEIAEQNEKIAKGLVAINDIVGEKLEEITRLVEGLRTIATDFKEMKMEFRKLSSRPASSMQMSRPQPAMQPMPQGSTVPPPPTQPTGEGPQRMDIRPPKKRGLFG